MLGLGVVLGSSGCTFVTNCPCADAGGTGGGNAQTGGTGGGGTGNTSGTGSGGVNGGSPGDDGEWVNVTSNLAGLESICGNLTLVQAKPDEDVLIAGIASLGLFES